MKTTNKTEHTPTPVDIQMENIAVLDLLTREGYSGRLIDRIETAVNSHEALLEMAKGYLDFLKDRIGAIEESEIEEAKRIIAQAEGK